MWGQVPHLSVCNSLLYCCYCDLYKYNFVKKSYAQEIEMSLPLKTMDNQRTATFHTASLASLNLWGQMLSL